METIAFYFQSLFEAQASLVEGNGTREYRSRTIVNRVLRNKVLYITALYTEEKSKK